MDMRVYALLVIYNRRCEDSPSCEQLRQNPQARAVVADNSTKPNDNARYCVNRGFGYVSMGGNAGLAKAYNRGIDWIRKNTDATHVLLLDDDTTLPDGFLEGTAAFFAAHPDVQIALPLVYDEVGLLSPCAISGFRVTRISNPSALTKDTVTGINSGMVIDLSVFDHYAFDEGYFLDYIDHAFLRDMHRLGVKIGVTKQRLTQCFFGNARGQRAAARKRLAIFKKDFRRFCGTSFKGRLTAWATVWRRTLKVWLSR